MLVSHSKNDYINNAMEACHFTPVLLMVLHTKLHLTLYLILTHGVFVNLDCNLQTTEAKPATVTDVGCSTKQITRRHSFIDIVDIMFLENCQSNSE